MTVEVGLFSNGFSIGTVNFFKLVLVSGLQSCSNFSYTGKLMLDPCLSMLVTACGLDHYSCQNIPMVVNVKGNNKFNYLVIMTEWLDAYKIRHGG